MNAKQLYDRLKDALDFFGLRFHQMDQVEVRITALGVEFHHAGLMVQVGVANNKVIN